ncbi:hypothetical protein BHE74_00059158, partial [Ensete ventricosum]
MWKEGDGRAVEDHSFVNYSALHWNEVGNIVEGRASDRLWRSCMTYYTRKLQA